MEVENPTCKADWMEEMRKGQKTNLHQRKNWLVDIDELTARSNPTVSDLRQNEQGVRKFREKKKNS